MVLIELQRAADMMGVPVAWVKGMIEIGGLTGYVHGPGGQLVDEEEIIEKNYTDPKLKAASLEHMRALMRKVGACNYSTDAKSGLMEES